MTRILDNAHVGASGLSLELLPHVAMFRHEDEPEITAWLRNDGDRPLTLVMPGDGSLEGWRTPVIRWVFTPDDAGATPHLDCMATELTAGPELGAEVPVPLPRGCGNINGIRRDEVFTLAPGEERSLGEAILPPFLPGSAACSASLTYANVPTIPWRGVPLRPHDETALALVRESDSCRVRSNEIRMCFEEYPGDARRTWFPELVATLRERWSEGMTCEQLIAFRADVQRQLGAIRAGRGIKAGSKWIQSDRYAGIRIMQRCSEPRISVRALILALGRYHIAPAQVVSDLEQRWRLFRREHGLDLQGARTPNKPLQPTSGAVSPRQSEEL
jgi:hypothetical protein